MNFFSNSLESHMDDDDDDMVGNNNKKKVLDGKKEINVGVHFQLILGY